MKFRASAIAFTTVIAASGGALAQSIPSISSIWDDTRLSQTACVDRAQQAMRSSGFTRIETIGQTTFGDRSDYQVGIRCVTDKGMYYIYGGGPDEPVIRRYIDELKANMGR